MPVTPQKHVKALRLVLMPLIGYLLATPPAWAASKAIKWWQVQGMEQAQIATEAAPPAVKRAPVVRYKPRPKPKPKYDSDALFPPPDLRPLRRTP